MKVVKKGYTGPNVTNTETFIKKSIWQHGNKYDYALVEYRAAHDRVTIICREHGEFSQRASDHTNKGAGCPSCRNESTGSRCKIGKEKFIENALKIYGNRYDYSLVEYVTARSLVKIQCSVHGIFEKTPYSHVNLKRGCYECYMESIRKPVEPTSSYFDKFNTEYFIKRSVDLHGDQYSYDKVNYINSVTKVTITCPQHGDFLQKPNTHLNGSGCRECRKENLRKAYQKSKEGFVEDAQKIHGDRYNYDNVEYVSNKHKVEIICPDHGSFWQKPNNHLYAEYGCPLCADKFSGGWGRSNGYYNTDKPSNLYLISMKNDVELFVKVGLAKDLDSRHNQIMGESGYEITKVFSVEGKASDLFEIEFDILNMKQFKKYRPKIIFGGVSECFEFEEESKILSYIKERCCV